MNHQKSRGNFRLKESSPALPKVQANPKLNKEKVKELDLKAFFDKLQTVKAIVEGTDKPQEIIMDELHRNPWNEILKEAA